LVLTRRDQERIMASDTSPRHYFFHSAHESVGVAHGAAALAEAAPSPRSEVVPRLLDVCFVSNATKSGYGAWLGRLQETLYDHCGIRSRWLFARAEDRYAGLRRLGDCDCLLLWASGMAVRGELLEAVWRYCRSGGAVVSLGVGGRAFRFWPDFEPSVLGARWRGHHLGFRAVRIEPADALDDHPVLGSVPPLEASGGLPRFERLSRDVTPLLVGRSHAAAAPVAWTRKTPAGRIFGSTLGHPRDFSQRGFLRLVANAVQWTTARGGW
jgi:hypothetical protein